jgi:hypothetical protein
VGEEVNGSLRLEEDHHGNVYTMRVDVSKLDMAAHGRDAVQSAAEAITKAIADRYIAEHLQDVMKALDPAAIANMVAISVGERVRASIVEDAQRRLK